MNIKTPWNGEIPAGQISMAGEQLRELTNRILGHVRREQAYRRMSFELLQQIKSLEDFTSQPLRTLLRDAREVWEKQFDDISKL